MFIKKRKLGWMCLLLLIFSFGCVACGNQHLNKEENTPMTESEVEIEIADATDILLKVWMEFDKTELDVMGGHYSDPAMGAPAKYDLSQTNDLIQTYCVPETQITLIDDAATIVDLYNAARFTASAFHLTDSENQKNFIEEMQKKIAENEWHGEVPEKVFVVGIEEEYVVAVYGRKELVDEFEKILEKITK